MSKQVEIAGIPISVGGKWVKVAKARFEWDVDISEPERMISEVKRAGVRADLFTFIQRLPSSLPKYPYAMQWDNVAAIPITDHGTWLRKQITRNARNKLKKAEKDGIVVAEIPADENLWAKIKEVQDDCPIRQGKKFSHYGESLEKIKKGNGVFLERSVFFGAFYRDEIVGYIKVVRTTGYARVMGILAKVSHIDKAPMNALVSRAVEYCSSVGVPYLVYAKYAYGISQSESLLEFKQSTGFEHILLPRYYVPLNAKGKVAMALGYPDAFEQMIPKGIIAKVRDLRGRYVQWRYRELLEQPKKVEAATTAPAASQA